MNPAMVAVTGLTSSGHALLWVGGFYFHADQAWYAYPKWMDEDMYQAYLRVNNKKEIWREIAKGVTDPAKARAKLRELINDLYFWGGMAHNCVHFVEEVFQAGGSKAGLHWNLPLKPGRNLTPGHNLSYSRLAQVS
ncbi:MAG: hypothetical protein U1F68_14635 [Gammaproteobacteria bacterium]